MSNAVGGRREKTFGGGRAGAEKTETTRRREKRVTRRPKSLGVKKLREKQRGPVASYIEGKNLIDPKGGDSYRKLCRGA